MTSEPECTPVSINGIDVWPLREDELIRIATERIIARQGLLIGVVNAAKIVNAQKNTELCQALDESDIVVADGLAVVWLSHILGSPLPERVAGIDIMFALLKVANDRQFRIFFLGAKPEVLKKVIEATERDYPGVQIAGYRDGYFGPDEEQQVADTIRDSRADILFVAISPPKKEIFLRKWRDHMKVPVCHGVGGSFDVFSGITKRAPVWIQRIGMEWLYRVWQEPRRMWKRYLVTNTLFLKICIVALVKRCFGKCLGRSHAVKPQTGG